MEWLTGVDGAILLWIQEFIRNDALTPLFTGITKLGDKGLIWILLSLIFLCFRKTRQAGVTAILALILSFLVTNLILKNLVARTRPFDAVEGLISLIGRPKDFSFPSGHSSGSLAAASVFFRKLPRWAGVPLLVLAVMISLLRLYVGVHYPSDVIVGIGLGAGLGFCAEKLWACWAERKQT